MSALLLIARLFLAAVFGVAAVGKLRNRAEARTAVVGLGLPAFSAGFIAGAMCSKGGR